MKKYGCLPPSSRILVPVRHKPRVISVLQMDSRPAVASPEI